MSDNQKILEKWDIILNIAIIGSGMAGLAAARILKDAGHTITIFEALPGRGMDSHSIEFDGGIIDAPLRVMNPHLWKNTLSLAAHLGIKTFPVRTYMSCSWLFEDRTETWLTTSRSRIGNFPIINNRKGIQQYGWRLVKGMLQLKTAIHQFSNLKIKILPSLNLLIRTILRKYSGMVWLCRCSTQSVHVIQNNWRLACKNLLEFYVT